jgi:transcriptional regulator with XRE-family HTH domain
MEQLQTSAGGMIREWRQRRHMSQLDLAVEAEISQRHLSFVESGRAKPSRDMALHIAERLGMPLRQRNRLLLAAGYAPSFGERKLDDPALKPALDAVELVLRAHEPNPAMAVDRHWNMVLANRAIAPFMAAATDKFLLEPPINVLRLSLHPQGLAPLIANLAEWRAHLLERLAQLNDLHADPLLAELERELRGYPGGATTRPVMHNAAIAVPLKLRTPGGLLSFISTITVFGTPLDVTLSEMAVETFFPADETTATYLRQTLAG